MNEATEQLEMLTWPLAKIHERLGAGFVKKIIGVCRLPTRRACEYAAVRDGGRG